jgi:hypothetical protein
MSGLSPNPTPLLRKSKSSNFVQSSRQSASPDASGDRNWKSSKKGWVGSVMDKVKGSKLKHNV